MSFPLKIAYYITLYLLALLGAYHLFTGDFRPFKFPSENKGIIGSSSESINTDGLKSSLKEKFQSFFDGAKKKTEEISTEKVKESAGNTYVGILNKAKDFFKKTEEKEKATGSPSDLLRASLSEDTKNNKVGL